MSRGEVNMKEKELEEFTEQFIEQNKKICWEATYEKGQYCLGENKVRELVKIIKEKQI